LTPVDPGEVAEARGKYSFQSAREAKGDAFVNVCLWAFRELLWGFLGNSPSARVAWVGVRGVLEAVLEGSLGVGGCFSCSRSIASGFILPF